MTVKQTITEKDAKKNLEPRFGGKYIETVGRRKTAVARVRLYYTDKKKKIFINDKDYKQFLVTLELIKIVEGPLKTTGRMDLSISIKVKSGGVKSQAQAACHGIARALIKLDKELRPALKPKGFLTRDSRKKERKKPGLKRARKASQWSKR